MLLALAATSCGYESRPGDADPSAPPPPEKICHFDEPAWVPQKVALSDLCGCTRITGTGGLFLDASQLDDISCLHTLREISGMLVIGLSAPPPARLESLTGLEQLRSVDSLKLLQLPLTDLGVFSNLRSAALLDISHLDQLQDLHGLSHVEWQILGLSNNAELRSLNGLRAVKRVTAITLSANPKLEHLRALRGMREASTVHLEGLDALATLEGLEGEIDSFELHECSRIVDLAGLNANIERLWLQNNASLRSLRGFSGLRSRPTTAVIMIDLPELEDLSGLIQTEGAQLSNIALSNLPKLVSVDLHSLARLTQLGVDNCHALQEIRGLHRLESLNLALTGLPQLHSLPELSSLRSALDLQLSGLDRISSLEQLSTLEQARNVSLGRLPNLTTLHGLEQLSKASSIIFEHLPLLESLEGLRGLQQVDKLWIEGAGSTENLRGLSVKRVPELFVRYNDKLQTLDGLEQLTGSANLVVEANPALRSVRALAGLREPGLVYVRLNPELPQCELDWLAMRLPPASKQDFAYNGAAGSCEP